MASVAKVTLPDMGASLKERERVIEAPGVVGITIDPDLAESPELSGSRGTQTGFPKRGTAPTVRQ